MFNSFTSADHERVSRLAALAVCVLAGVIALVLLVRLLWLAVPHADVTSEIAPSASPIAVAAPQSIAKWHLFGNPQSVNLAQLARNAPTTALKLVLRGTLALQDAKQGIAMIADEQGRERSYNVGDEVAPNAKLAEVYTDHVVITHEGAPEMLQLPRPEMHAPIETSDTNARNLATTPTPGKPVNAPFTYTPPQVANGALDWSKVQKQAQADPAELARQVHVEPVFQGGKIAGARLSAGGQIGALIAQAGLKPTDMITAVNGTALSGVSNPQQFIDGLQNAASLQVTVLRDGKPATLTLNLR